MPQISQLEKPTGIQEIKARTNYTPGAKPAPQEQAQLETPEQQIQNGQEEEKDPRFEALSKKEKWLLQQKKLLDDEKKQLEERFKPLERYKEVDELLQKDKLAALNKLGISYDEHTNLMLNQTPQTPEQIAEVRAKQLVEERVQQLEKQLEEQKQRDRKVSYDAALLQLKNQAIQFVNKNEDFPIVKTAELFDDVIDLVEHAYNNGIEGLENYEKPGSVMPIEQAVKLVEEYNEEKLLAWAKLPKYKEKLSELVGEKPTLRNNGFDQTQTPKLQTLTHKATTAPTNGRSYSDQERRQRAIDAFYGRLKQ